ncbi:MAG: hypothetical protein ACM3U2_05535, partial [Deltaproteobacteria bacterium]
MMRLVWTVSVLGICLAAGRVHGQARTQDVSWLHRVQQPVPKAPREGIGTLAPLLVDETGKTIATRDGWELRRKKIRDEWLKFLGPMPDPRPEVKVEILKTE